MAMIVSHAQLQEKVDHLNVTDVIQENIVMYQVIVSCVQ